MCSLVMLLGEIKASSVIRINNVCITNDNYLVQNAPSRNQSPEKLRGSCDRPGTLQDRSRVPASILGADSAGRFTRCLRTRGKKLHPADAGAPAGGPQFAVTAGTGEKGPPYLARVPAQGCCRGSGEPRAGPGVLEVTGRGPATTWAGAGRPPSPPGARSPSAPGGRCGARGTLPAPEAEPEIRFAPAPAPFQRAEARGWVLDPNPQGELPGNPARSQRSSRPAGTGERRARHSREAGQGKAARRWKAPGRPERIPRAESGSPRPASGRRISHLVQRLTWGPAFDLSCRNT
ncbi:hypothetical protein AB1E18_017060 [Capra hircus]